MLAYLLPMLLTSADVRLVFDDPDEAWRYDMAAVSTGTIEESREFVCEHKLDKFSLKTITCEWTNVLRIVFPSPTPAPHTPPPTASPTPVPTPVQVLIS